MFYPLMLLETASNPFSSPDYIFEPKYDGIRVEFSNVDIPLLYTRNGNLINRQFPELLPKLDKKLIVDGELIALNHDEKEDFEGIMKRFRMKKEEKIREHTKIIPISYKVFDLLYFDGQDLRNKTLKERKALLEKSVEDNNVIQKVDYKVNVGADYFEQVVNNNMEGMVAKKLNSLYIGKRSSSWLKIINWLDVEALIAGYRKKDHALLCCHESGKTLGLVLSGMSPTQKEAFFRIAKQLHNQEDSHYYYLKPLLKCRLKGRGFLSTGILRSPIFIDFIL